MELNQWAFVGVLFVVVWFFPAAPILLAKLLGPRKPNAAKNDTYECGVETVGSAWVQFKAQYYVYALVFLIFDIEMVFLFPWAVAYKALPLFAVVEMIIFIAILAVALVYAWRKGALEWR